MTVKTGVNGVQQDCASAFPNDGQINRYFQIISEKPIPWHTQYVNVMLLLCISERDRMLFYDIFDNLISLFVEEKYVQEIAKCKDYTNLRI